MDECKSNEEGASVMIIYQGISDEIHVYDSDFFDGQRDSDPLLDIVEGVVLAGYQGIFIHTKRLASGEDFVGINFREDTPEGKIFSDIQTDFYQGLVIPDSRAVLKKIRRVYEQEAKR
jgi:hypothetical protein